MRIAARFCGEGLAYEGLAKMTAKGPRWTNKIRLIYEKITEPLKWKTARQIFVNSMSDAFHKDVPVEFIEAVFNTMNKGNWHTYQVLTKRSERLLELDAKLLWNPHIWMGVSVENQDYTFRLDHLRQTHAHTKFASLEPLLGSLPNLNLEGIDWVIVGGESGPDSRPMKKEWVIDIRDQCIAAGVPFFFKQWGGTNKKRNGRDLEGRTWDEMPNDEIS